MFVCVSVRGRASERAHTWGLSEGKSVEDGGGWLLSKFPLPRVQVRTKKQGGGEDIAAAPQVSQTQPPLPGVPAKVAGSKALSMHNALEASFS